MSDVYNKTGLSSEEIWNEMKHFKMNLSIVAIINSKISGFYFLGDDPIPKIKNKPYEFENLKGIEGIALGVLKEYKNMGVGKQLINYPRNLYGVDYI